MAKRVVEPWKPATYTKADVAALQSLEKGVAGPHEQQRALKFIVEELGMTYQHTHFEGDRDTCFANGRRFVGLQIVKLLRLKVTEIQGKDVETNV